MVKKGLEIIDKKEKKAMRSSRSRSVHQLRESSSNENSRRSSSTFSNESGALEDLDAKIDAYMLAGFKDKMKAYESTRDSSILQNLKTSMQNWYKNNRRTSLPNNANNLDNASVKTDILLDNLPEKTQIWPNLPKVPDPDEVPVKKLAEEAGR